MHLSEDHDFLTNLLGNSSAHAQQDSDPNSSGSDLDGSALVNSSDSDDAGTQPRSFDRLSAEGPSTSANKHTTSDTQAIINQIINDCKNNKQVYETLPFLHFPVFWYFLIFNIFFPLRKFDIQI